MKIKDARITLLADSGNPPGGEPGVTIELHDYDASVMFAKVTLTPEQWVSAMSRLGYVECEIEVYGLDKLGKKMINEPFEFCLGKSSKYTASELKDVAIEMVKEACPDGWIADSYFQSQDSFFFKDGETWARTTIRKWVDVEDETT